MNSIRKLADGLYHRDLSKRIQSFSALIQLRKIEPLEQDAKYLIKLLHKKTHKAVAEWDHPRQTLLIFLKHYPTVSSSNKVISTYDLLRSEEKGLLLELLLKWETKECLTSFFQFFERDCQDIPTIDLLPLLQQLHYVGIHFSSLLPALEIENYQDFLLYLFFEAKLNHYINSAYDETIAQYIKTHFPKALNKIKEYDQDYTVEFVYGPWSKTYLPIRHHIKMQLRVMWLINRTEFSYFYEQCINLKDDVLSSEAWINMWDISKSYDLSRAKDICKSYEGCINFYQAYTFREITTEFDELPFSLIHLVESHIVYRLTHIEKMPYHTISIKQTNMKRFNNLFYHIFTFTSTDSPWDELGSLYAFCGPFTKEEGSFPEIKEAFTKIYVETLTYDQLLGKMAKYHQDSNKVEEEYFGEFRQEVPPLYYIGFGIVSVLLLIQILGNNNYFSSGIYTGVLLLLSFLLHKRYKNTRKFRFVMNNDCFYYYCGKIKFNLQVDDIYRVKEEIRTVRKEETNFLKKKQGYFLIFYNVNEEEILRVPIELIQKQYFKKILRFLNVTHIHF